MAIFALTTRREILKRASAAGAAAIVPACTPVIADAAPSPEDRMRYHMKEFQKAYDELWPVKEWIITWDDSDVPRPRILAPRLVNPEVA